MRFPSIGIKTAYKYVFRNRFGKSSSLVYPWLSLVIIIKSSELGLAYIGGFFLISLVCDTNNGIAKITNYLYYNELKNLQSSIFLPMYVANTVDYIQRIPYKLIRILR